MTSALKTYPAPWPGQILLACRKCQKKLKAATHAGPLAKLKKTVKRHRRQHSAAELSVINVPCMDLCPKGGVTICDPSQNPPRLQILWDVEDLDRFLHFEARS